MKLNLSDAFDAEDGEPIVISAIPFANSGRNFANANKTASS
jgi:hypothetical protein